MTHMLIIRAHGTGRTCSVNFTPGTDIEALLDSVRVMAGSIGIKASKDDIAALDLEIETLIQRRALLSGEKPCHGCGGRKKHD